MVEPTKGPWERKDRQRIGHRRDIFGGGRHIASVHTAFGTWDINESNARLIAASPDLLAALVAIRECTFIDRTKMLDTPCQDCMDAVNAAIAKAKGEPCPTE